MEFMNICFESVFISCHSVRNNNLFRLTSMYWKVIYHFKVEAELSSLDVCKFSL